MRATPWLRQSPFVGRQPELSVLLDRLDAAASGRGSVALVSGEAGAGKTRLVGELAERARAAGWTVLTGRAYETEGLPPYLPFREALTAYARARADDELRALLGDRAAAIARLAPEVRRLGDLPPDPPLSPEDELWRTGPWLTERPRRRTHRDAALRAVSGCGGRTGSPRGSGGARR